MNASETRSPAAGAIAAAAARSRSLETAFIVERYHRAFQAEVVQLREWLRHTGRAQYEVIPALSELDARLRAHAAFQEQHVFPLFEAGTACSPRLFEAWARDALRLFGALDGLHAACWRLDAPAPLNARIVRLSNEIQDHLVAEAQVLAGWRGFDA